MIVDSSAFLAIFFDEPEKAEFIHRLATASARRMSAASYVEVGLKVDRLDDLRLSAEVDELVGALRIELVPLTTEHARMARAAFQFYGRGRHPAQLNFGDCLTYGLAKTTGEPLLFKGDDFTRTDIPSAR